MRRPIWLPVVNLPRRIGLVFLAGVTVSFPQQQQGLSNETLDSIIVQAKGGIQTALETRDIGTLQQARNVLERLLAAGEREWLIRYYLAYADYRLSTIAEKKELARGYLEDGISQAKKSIELKGDFAETHALLSSLYGQEIGFKPELGMTNGIKSGREMGRAYELDPDNPRVHLIDGIGTWHKPAVLGGGAKKALSKLLKAAECYERDRAESVGSLKSALLPSWGSEEVHVWIGRIRFESKEKERARRSFRRALEINPFYGWASQLLKELEKSEDGLRDGD